MVNFTKLAFMKIYIYLNFDGQCEAAFNFYKSVFNKNFEMISHFKDMPDSKNIAEEHMGRVMHVSLPIGEDGLLMGSDSMSGYGPPHKMGNNFSVSINLEDKAEGERIFKALSEGGNITMPMADTFWNAYFGTLVDKFGVNWMVSVE